MDLVALETFKLVMDLGSVTAAAEKLNTVQPNVTARLRKLEAELGTALFLRAHRRLTPTHEAHKLLDYANAISTLVQAAKNAVSPSSTGDIRFGFVSTQAARWLPHFISRYKDSYPKADIRVDTGATESLVSEVVGCRMDAALVVENHAGYAASPDLVTRNLFPEKLVVVAPPGTADLEQAFTYPLMVLRQEAKGYRNFAHDLFQSMGRDLPHLMRITTLDGVLACIRSGLGYSVLPSSVVQSRQLQQDLTILSPEAPDIGIQIALVYRAELKRDPRITHLTEIFADPAITAIP